MSRHDITQRRLDAADDIVLLFEAMRDLAERARGAGDRGTELVALDAAEALIAVADRLLYNERGKGL